MGSTVGDGGKVFMIAHSRAVIVKVVGGCGECISLGSLEVFLSSWHLYNPTGHFNVGQGTALGQAEYVSV